MRLRFTSALLAAALAIAPASLGFAQDQHPGNDQNPSSAPQSSAPQTTPQTPPSNDTQNAAPPQNQPDQTTPKAEPAPSNPNAPATQEQSPPQKEASPEQAAPEANPAAQPKPATSKSTRNRKRKAQTTAQSKSTPRPKSSSSPSSDRGKVVVRNGGASDDVIHLSPGGSQEQNAHNRENTTQLLATTDENLKRLSGRQLSPAEQGTVDQIHSYMRQAKSAEDSGDLARAHTLAFKAHLLSDDLAKH